MLTTTGSRRDKAAAVVLVPRVREIAAALPGLPRRNCADLAAIGSLLIEAKMLLPRGAFLPWLRDYLPFNHEDGRRAMRLAKDFADCLSALTPFSVSCQRLLAHRKLRSAWKRKMLREFANVGSANFSDLYARLDAHGLSWVALRAAKLAGNEENSFTRAGRLLHQLIEIGDVRISFDRDSELATFTVSLMGAEHLPLERCHAQRVSLVNALAAAAGEEEFQTCPTCGEPLLPDMFAKSTRNCRICERARVKSYGKKKRPGRVA